MILTVHLEDGLAGDGDAGGKTRGLTRYFLAVVRSVDLHLDPGPCHTALGLQGHALESLTALVHPEGE